MARVSAQHMHNTYILLPYNFSGMILGNDDGNAEATFGARSFEQFVVIMVLPAIDVLVGYYAICRNRLNNSITFIREMIENGHLFFRKR